MGAPSVLTVVLTGILLVFFMLLLLTALITAFGAIMRAFNKPKTSPVTAEPVVAAAPVAAPVINNTVADDTEIIAVISAAVAAMDAGTVVSIKKQQQGKSISGNSVNAWKQSSILSYLQQV